MRRTRELLFSRDTLKLETLTTPINRLGLTIEGTPLADAARIAREDMRRARIKNIDPIFYLSTGYGTVEGTTNIALGFYDCNEILRELNQEFRRWKYSYEDILATVRHEIGHAFCYAYKLYRRRDFRKVFNVRGHFFNTYPVTNRYIKRANPWSRDYVNPSGDHYAQKHPDDDFAETFLVWLTPRSNWKREYRAYPGALAKLEYVDWITKELGREQPLIENNDKMIYEPIEDLELTVAQFMRARTTKYRREATGFVDPDLVSMFRRRPAQRNGRRIGRDFVPAERCLSRNKRVIASRVSHWVGVDEIVVKDLLDKLRQRAHALDLWLKREDQETKLVELTAYVSTRCAWYAVTETYFGK